MPPLSYPLQFLLAALAGWINQQQRDVIDYLQAENRVLREQLGPKRLRFTNDQRIRLAAKAKHLRRRVLRGVRSIVSPDTLLGWPRQVIARQYDGHLCRGPGRPPVTAEIRSWSCGWRRRIATGATRGSQARSQIWAMTWAAEPSPRSCGSTGLSRLPSARRGRRGRSF